MNLRILSCLLSISLLLSACHKDKEPWQGTIAGKAQKGPFLNGSTLTIFELDDQLSQTGRSFNAQISNNAGSFSLGGVSLVSSFALLRVDGFYFNEVCGNLSNTQITLNGIVSGAEAQSYNLNVLTTLEYERVRQLVDAGTSFSNAKIQAQAELLAAFNMSVSGSSVNSEQLDMSGSTDGDAAMIALSCIIQGHRSESKMSSLLANFVSDFGPDGQLEDADLITDLVLHAQSLNLTQIRSHIEERYSELGIPVSVPDFESNINDFLSANAPVTDRSVIDFPENALYSANVLYLNRTEYPAGGPYSFAANMPDDCVSVKIRISKLAGPVCYGCWGFITSSLQNWSNGGYDSDNFVQEFTSSGINCDSQMTFAAGTVLFEYFQDGATSPTLSKVVEFIE